MPKVLLDLRMPPASAVRRTTWLRWAGRCRKAAEQGYAEAQYQLGRLYAHGNGGPQDYVAAANWFRKAADQGNAWAQCYLGTMYTHGDGVPQDQVAAVGWLKKAAEQGNVLAQRNLGLHYLRGEGVPPDALTAISWFRKAADQGDADAQCDLGFMYDLGGRDVPPGLCQVTHVVHLGGCRRKYGCTTKFRKHQLTSDSGSDGRSAETRTRMEAHDQIPLVANVAYWHIADKLHCGP